MHTQWQAATIAKMLYALCYSKFDLSHSCAFPGYDKL